jgi:hypothetical protein
MLLFLFRELITGKVALGLSGSEKSFVKPFTCIGFDLFLTKGNLLYLVGVLMISSPFGSGSGPYSV